MSLYGSILPLLCAILPLLHISASFLLTFYQFPLYINFFYFLSFVKHPVSSAVSHLLFTTAIYLNTCTYEKQSALCTDLIAQVPPGIKSLNNFPKQAVIFSFQSKWPDRSCSRKRQLRCLMSRHNHHNNTTHKQLRSMSVFIRIFNILRSKH